MVLRGAVPPLPKIHLLNPTAEDRMRSTAAKVVGSWAAPLLRSRSQCLNGSDSLCFEHCLSASESQISAVKSETKATKSSMSSDGPGMTSDSSHRASFFSFNLNRVGGSFGAVRMACARRAWRRIPKMCPHGQLRLLQRSNSWKGRMSCRWTKLVM